MVALPLGLFLGRLWHPQDLAKCTQWLWDRFKYNLWTKKQPSTRDDSCLVSSFLAVGLFLFIEGKCNFLWNILLLQCHNFTFKSTKCECSPKQPATPATGFVYQNQPQLPKVTTFRPETPLDHIQPKVTTYRPKIHLATTPQPHISTYRPHEHTQGPPLEHRAPQPHSHQFYRDGQYYWKERYTVVAVIMWWFDKIKWSHKVIGSTIWY